MIFTDNISKLIKNHLEKSNISKNKIACISTYSYFDIEGQMTSLIRMSTNILKKEQMSRKYKKDFFAKHASNKNIWKYIQMVKKFF